MPRRIAAPPSRVSLLPLAIRSRCRAPNFHHSPLTTHLFRQAVGLLVSLTILLATGCQQPLKVSADARLIPDFAAAGNSGSVQPMSLPERCPDNAAPAIAVIDVDGVLLNTDFSGLSSAGENPVSLFRERLDAAACDECVQAIVVRINSPGGGVTATDIMWHDLASFREHCDIPVVACLMDTGAGGAYYLATAADQIVAHPTTVTGGIGVILNLYNLQDALQQFNVAPIPVRSGEKIDIGSPIKSLDDEQKKLLQTMANNFHDRFIQVIREQRPEVDGNDKSNFDGRVFTAEEALQRKLIDHIGYLDDAINLAAGWRISVALASCSITGRTIRRIRRIRSRPTCRSDWA